ncbi:hypothetical protein NQ317_005994 [Molorchus minor]|uniref:Transposase n=1 Tax=Molorchus minor TaxID=1323400 RepID=A0ABQ9J6W1_9CUCU|nr:hypothetical protein NQ317_005994 [Molorchus minor]
MKHGSTRAQGEKVWQDEIVKNAWHAAIEGWSMPSGKGRRLVITHMKVKTDFQRKRDYHKEMDVQVYEKWFGRILDNLGPGSVVVMDNVLSLCHLVGF